MNRVILLAGGSGARMKSEIAKQHIVIDNHQIIEYTLQAFSICKQIDEIYIIANPKYLQTNAELKEKFDKVKAVIPGGKKRSISVYNAIEFISSFAGENDKIIISDAVRPCITIREMVELLEQLDDKVAATTGVEVYETILKTNDSKCIKNIIQREGVFRQTSPEAYIFKVLKELYLNQPFNIVCSYKNIGIDQLFEKGETIGLVKSSPLNFKITKPEDLYYFETVLKKGFNAIIHAE